MNSFASADNTDDDAAVPASTIPVKVSCFTDLFNAYGYYNTCLASF